MKNWMEFPVNVAPLAGAWIEIRVHLQYPAFVEVAPLAGAWIEIQGFYIDGKVDGSRSPRGSVD